MGGTVIDACLFDVGGEGLQDLENLIAIVASAEQGQSEVAGHDRLKG
jgi:hypothetical protein